MYASRQDASTFHRILNKISLLNNRVTPASVILIKLYSYPSLRKNITTPLKVTRLAYEFYPLRVAFNSQTNAAFFFARKCVQHIRSV